MDEITTKTVGQNYLDITEAAAVEGFQLELEIMAPQDEKSRQSTGTYLLFFPKTYESDKNFYDNCRNSRALIG